MNARNYREVGITLLVLSAGLIWFVGHTGIAHQMALQIALVPYGMLGLITLAVAIGCKLLEYTFHKNKHAGTLEREKKKCPYCAEGVQLEAKLCRNCGKEV